MQNNSKLGNQIGELSAIYLAQTRRPDIQLPSG